MNIEYLRTASASYLIVRDYEGVAEDFTLPMIQHNVVGHLVSVKEMVGNGSLEYWYEITGLQSLESACSLEEIEYPFLLDMIQNISDLKSVLEEYLLEEDDILYRPETIFRNKTDGKLEFCYLPGYHRMQQDGLKTFFEMIIGRIDHRDKKAVSVGYEIYDHLCNGMVAAKTLYECTQKEEFVREEAVVEAQAEPLFPTEWREQQDAILKQRECTQKEKTGWFQKAKKLFQKKSAEEKPILLYSEITKQEDKMVAEYTEHKTISFTNEILTEGIRLCYRGDRSLSDIKIDHFPFYIGSDEHLADGRIEGEAISRMHAKILYEEGNYFLQDENSTNGTFLNGYILAYHTPALLQNKDRILFASEPYSVVIH